MVYFKKRTVKLFTMKNIKTYTRFLKVVLLCILMVGEFSLLAQTAESFSTFHCISLYWKPADASADNECKVKYRKEGETEWKQGMSLWFDPNTHEGLPERSNEYRGSLVDLVPGTNYEIQLELEKTGTTTSLSQKTMSETFPIFKTIKLEPGERNEPLNILSGGNRFEGYVLYDASDVDFVIDVKKQYDYCVRINAPYVIIRGLTLKGAKNHGITLGNVSNVVIEECDISEYGSPETSGTLAGYGINYHAAIFGESSNLASNMIIQRNKLHHPSTDANSWMEPQKGTHPLGPWGITFHTKGFNIIRYNEIYSDMDHMFNDGMGAPGNFSFAGWPNRDSDVYGNKVSHVWDDAIQAEGSGMNVRIWSNYIDTVNTCFGLAGASLGPIYVFRNLSHYSQVAPYPLYKHDWGNMFFKLGGSSANYKYARGRIAIFHNTSFQPPSPWNTGTPTAGVQNGISHTTADKFQDNVLSRNNILHVRADKSSVHDHSMSPKNDYDYDMYSGKVIAANNPETHGIKRIPQYDPENLPGEYYLAAGTPGHDQAQLLPGFNSSFEGNGPDMGAFERDYPPLLFGINADWNEWVDAVNSLSTSYKQLSLNEGEKNNLFITYPNPAMGKVIVQFTDNFETISLSVYNLNGIKVFSDILSSNRDESFLIQLNNWSKGIYIVEAVCDKGIQKARFVVN